MSKPQLILIEDDANAAALLVRHLEKAGYAVRTAESVASARELVREYDWDLALLDRGLPDGDGMTLCRELREEHPHGYIMMLTGYDSEESKVESFEVGADDYLVKGAGMPELLARIRAGLRIVELQKALLELTVTDGLTSLKNRRAFEQELIDAYEHGRRYDRALAIAIIDLDHFKNINDTFGHQAGDAVLRSVAQVLDHGTRQSDFVARIGGEEFAIILPETELEEAVRFAEKIRTTLENSTIRTGDVAHHVTVSIGIAAMPHSSVRSGEELYHAADQALYRAKARGRNRVEIEKRRNRFAVLKQAV